MVRRIVLTSLSDSGMLREGFHGTVGLRPLLAHERRILLLGKIKDFFANQKERKIQKNLSIIANPKAIKEERSAALDFIGSFEDPAIAVPGLLKRFNYSLEHGINDTREKEKAMAGVLNQKEKALPFIVEHIAGTDRIAWPLKILYQVGSDEEVVEALKKSLRFDDVSFDQAAVDKNYDILCYLRDHKLPNYTDKLAHFLVDPDERVRFAAVEALIEQVDPKIPSLVEHFLLDETSENRRIRKSVVDAFVKFGWTVAHREAFDSELVYEGVFLTKDNRLEDRSRAQ